MGRPDECPPDERGVSNVTAVTLLIGLTLVGVALILLTGFGTISDTNQEANLEVAEETMLQVESVLEQTGDGNRTVSFPEEIEGKVGVSNEQTYNLVLDNNASCSTGNRALSSIKYEEDGQSVAYEGGGVFRMTESGATMVSPPDATYENGSLSLSFVNISGDISTTDELRTTANASRIRTHQYYLSRALYYNATYESAPDTLGYTCRPDEVENATLYINNSQYASAWARWARDNYDSSLVTVKPSGPVDPGQNISIFFPLRDTDQAEFAVSDVTATRESASDPVVVTANVTNTGGLRERVTADFEYAGGSVTGTNATSIGGGQSKRVQFRFTPGGSTSGTMTVSVPGDDATAPLTTGPNAVPEISLNDDGVPRSAAVGVSPSGAEVTLENTGGMTAFDAVDMYVDGDVTETYEDIVVAPGATKARKVGADLPTGNTGTHNVTFRNQIAPSERESITQFTVGESGYLRIQSVGPPLNVRSGDTVTVETTIENSGIKPLDGDVNVSIERLSSGMEVANTSESVDLNGTSIGAERESVSLDYAATDGVGNYSYRIETPNETRQGQFYVGVEDGPNLIVSGLNVSKSTVVKDNTTNFEIQLNNTGTETAEQTVWLNNTETGTTLKQRDVTVDAAEGTQFDWTVTADSPAFENGGNLLNVSTDNVTLSQNIFVAESGAAVRVDGDELIAERQINATVTMEGAELEGPDEFYEDCGFFCTNVYPAESTSPIRMRLVIDNGTKNSIPLWRDAPVTDGNVNHPLAEQRMHQSDKENIYTKKVTLDENATFALYATSYRCPVEEETDEYLHEDRPEGTDRYGFPCASDWQTYDDYYERLNISSDSNSDNVKILSDGDKVSDPVPGYPFQLTVSQMLDGRLNDNKRLQLADGEQVFMFELSDDDATYQEALNKPSDQGDPDYNDAIVRFQVTSATQNISTPGDLKITDYDAPARVNSGNDALLELTVGNDGGQTVTSDIDVTFDGTTQTVDTVELDPGETTNVTHLLDTSSKSVGENFQWTANVTEAERAERTGFVYVGQPTTPFFQVTGMNGPAVVDSDDPPEVAINVTNTGSVDDTQEVSVAAVAEDGRTFSDDTTVAVDAKTTENLTLALPSSKGSWTYNVSTGNVTTGDLELFVGQSDVYVPDSESVNIGLQNYSTSSLIERDGGIEAMSFELRNRGSVGDKREVQLELTYENGTTVDGFPESVTKQIGNGDLTGLGEVPAYVTFNENLDLGPGYYEYELTVYNDTAGEGVDDRVSGDLYLRSLSDGNTNPDNSPITIESGTIRVG